MLLTAGRSNISSGNNKTLITEVDVNGDDHLIATTNYYYVETNTYNFNLRKSKLALMQHHVQSCFRLIVNQ